jgi:hypothetical protein
LNACAICRQIASVLSAPIHVSQTMNARVIARGTPISGLPEIGNN